MMKAKFLPMLLLVFGLSIAVVALLTSTGGGNDISDIIKEKPLVKCDVTISPSFLVAGDAEIDKVSCLKTTETCRSIFSVNPLSLLDIEGKIIITAADNRKTVDYDISRFAGQETFTAELCTVGQVITVQTTNADGQITDSKEVTVV